MKKLLLIALSLFCLYSCVKKKAIKYDPDLVGTWVSIQDSTYYWFVVTPDGNGVFRSYENASNDKIISGPVKYSVFELKMWVGVTKFKVKEWLTGGMNGVDVFPTKEYGTLDNVIYPVDRRMIIKTPLSHSLKTLTFYRVRQ